MTDTSLRRLKTELRRLKTELDAAIVQFDDRISDITSGIKDRVAEAQKTSEEGLQAYKDLINKEVFAADGPSAVAQSFAVRLNQAEKVIKKLNRPFYKTRSFWSGVATFPAAILLGVGLDSMRGGWAGGVMEEPFFSGYIYEGLGVKSAVVHYIADNDDPLNDAVERLVIPTVTSSLNSNMTRFDDAFSSKVASVVTSTDKIKDYFAREMNKMRSQSTNFAHSSIVHTKHFALGQVVRPTRTPVACEELLENSDDKEFDLGILQTNNPHGCFKETDDGVFNSKAFTAFAYPANDGLKIEFAIGLKNSSKNLTEDEAKDLFALYHGGQLLELRHIGLFGLKVGTEEYAMQKYVVRSELSELNELGQHFPIRVIDVDLTDNATREFIAFMYIYQEAQ